VILDRDHNASLNILAKGLKQVGINSNTAGHAEINAWEQTDLYYEGGDINEQINWVNQESPRVHAPGVSIRHCLQQRYLCSIRSLGMEEAISRLGKVPTS